MKQTIKIPNNNKTKFITDHDYFFRSRETYSHGFHGVFIGLSRLDNGFLFDIDVPDDYEDGIDYHAIDGTNVSTHETEMPHEDDGTHPETQSELRKQRLLKLFVEQYGEEIFDSEEKFKSLMRELQIEDLE